MSDEKVIKVIASVPPKAEITVKELNTQINTPITEVELRKVDIVGIVVQKEPTFRVELDGYGEEVVPEPTLFRFAQHAAIATDEFMKESTKAFRDNSELTDYFTKFIGKLFAEIVVASDTFSRTVSFNRIISDIRRFCGAGQMNNKIRFCV